MVELDDLRELLEPQECARGHDATQMTLVNGRGRFGLSRPFAQYQCITCNREVKYKATPSFTGGHVEHEILHEGDLDPANYDG